MARGSASKTPRGATPKTGFLEKLKQLRSFVGPTISEQDLENCLKQCGCNIDSAATKLMTGEYKPQKAETGKKRGLSTFFNLTKSMSPDRNTSTQKKQRVSLGGNATPKLAAKTTPKLRATPVAAQTTHYINSNKGYLLCQRWLSAESRSKNGKVLYQEILAPTCSQTGPPMVRVSGKDVEGTLPRNLCHMMAPLLRQGLICLSAESLMEDRHLIIGAQVPINLRVSILEPKSFFALFDEMNKDTGSARNTYFGNLAAKKRNRKVEHMDLAVSAFDLLQWSQYGDVPEFKLPAAAEAKKDNDEAPTAKLSSNESSEDSGDDEEEILEESAFEAEQEADAWAEGVVEAASKDPLANLPEMPDPKGLAVTLRPYQRQALSWMWKRETDPSNREVVEQELKLLSELARNKAQQENSRIDVYQNQQSTDEISCDCGPVLVSEEGATKSTNLDGEVNPVTHPLWQRRFLAHDEMQSSVSFYINELLGIASAKSPNPPKQCVGGIQADAMGLGKTVMLLALLLQSKIEEDAGTTLVVAPLSLIAQWEEELASKTNLTHKVYYGDSAKLGIGKTTFKNVDVVVTTYGTLQGELFAMNKKKTRNEGLLSYEWFRVILDEAHCIKNAATLCSRACCLLQAERRWCVTGTPIQNSLQDAYSLLKFLRHEPWCEGGFWKAAITTVSNKKDDDDGDGMSLALDRVRRVLSPLILRRSKDTLNKDGEPILTLPPMEVKIVEVHLSTPEREFYNALKSKSESIFEGIVEKGSFTKSYFQIFALLNRLRQTCNHVALTVKSHMDDWSPTEILDSKVAKSPLKKKTAAEIQDGLNKQFLEGLLEKFHTKQPDKENHLENHQLSPTNDDGHNDSFCTQVATKLSQAVSSSSDEIEDECAICLENPKIADAVVTPCAHVFCRDCLVKVLRGAAPKNPTVPDGECPCCKAKIVAKRIIALHKCEDGKTETKYLLDTKFQRQAELSMDGAARQTLENALKGAGSAKLTAILHELDEIWKQDPGSKVLIFSQFLGFLDLLQLSLSKSQIPHGRLDGSLTLAQRKDVVEKFKTESSSSSATSNKGSVLLMSMKAGGVGLNLVQASSVFIVDPWWNAAIEDQCIMRCHRIGQVAPIVRVRKFVVQHSVEERIVKLQERKKNMAGQILDGTKVEENTNKATLDDFRLLFASI